jgi:hypothetical protein
MLYQGHAIFLAKGDIAIDADLGARCDSAAGGGACTSQFAHTTFPEQSLFTFYTPGTIRIGDPTSPSPASGAMGRFYAGTTFLVRSSSQIVGGVTARAFDLQGVPKFWQVKMPATVTALPGYGPQDQPARPSSRWEVREIHWKECSQRPVPAQPC